MALHILTICPVFGQKHVFNVGFRTIKSYDSSRIYKPESGINDSLHFRPIEIDLWYPADLKSSDTAATFLDFLHQVERRSNFYDDTRNYAGLSQELLQYFCQGLDCPTCDGLATLKTHSYPDAIPIQRKFPLIIYLSSFNGFGYENCALLEALAGEGFIVAAVSSIGRYPGDMTMEVSDLLEQVADTQFIIRLLAAKANITSDVCLLGYSWGGLAASIVAMKEQHKIKAIVSLDGSEQLTYTGDSGDKNLNEIRNSIFFSPSKIHSPILYMDSDADGIDDLPDSVYNMIDFVAGEKYYFKIKQAKHEDFSWLSDLCRSSNSKTKYDLIKALTTNFFLEKTGHVGVFYNNIPQNDIDKKFHQPMSAPASRFQRTLTGQITDKKTCLPLPYVNIGILGKEKGTVSDVSGVFRLPLTQENLHDTLRISIIGYQSLQISIRTLIEKQDLNLPIELAEVATELQEIILTGQKVHTKILGNQANSKFFGGKFAPGDLGGEIAVRIRVKNSPTYLETFSFNISYNAGDTATFRVNIYNIKNGIPNNNLLSENIIVKITGETGKVQIDLSKYNIELTDDFFIGLEWIEGRSNSGIVFSSRLGNQRQHLLQKSQSGTLEKTQNSCRI